MLRRTLIVSVMALALAACSRRIEVKNPQGGQVIVDDRVADVLKSDLPSDVKERVIVAILSQEKERSSNWRDLVREWLAFALAGYGIAK